MRLKEVLLTGPGTPVSGADSSSSSERSWMSVLSAEEATCEALEELRDMIPGAFPDAEVDWQASSPRGAERLPGPPEAWAIRDSAIDSADIRKSLQRLELLEKRSNFGTEDSTRASSAVGQLVNQESNVDAFRVWEEVEHELWERLPDARVSFASGGASVSGPSQAQLRAAATVLQRHPHVGVIVLGYTAKPSGRWKTQELCVELGLARARKVRHVLAGAGCPNCIAVQGLGHCDELGSRCELRLCSAEEAVAAETKERNREAAAPTAQSELQIDFVEPNTGSARVAVFRKSPMGICFTKATPVTVTEVDPQGQAAELGVQVGWVFTAIAGQEIAGEDFSSTLAILQDAVDLLPPTLSHF